MSGSKPIREEEEPQDIKNKQITELSDMVKILLDEQRSLKDKLDQQEQKMNSIGPNGSAVRNSAISDSSEVSMLMRKQREITKKASERTRSMNPQKKTVQSADSKTLHARKQKEQHAIEQAKLDAIQNKIEKARLRIEEVKVQRSLKAQQSVVSKNDKIGGGPASGEMNSDLMFGGDSEENIMGHIKNSGASSKPHVPLIGGRQKSTVGGANNERASFQP